MPMRLTFKTRSAGAASAQGRLRISADGTVSLVNNSNLSVAGVSTFYNHVTIDTTAAGTSATLTIRGGEGTQGQLRLIADDGDNATDMLRESMGVTTNDACSVFAQRWIDNFKARPHYTFQNRPKYIFSDGL